MVDPITTSATNQFTVTVSPSGQLDIACDPIDRNIVNGGDGVFGFDLPEGVTAERAKEIAACLNEHLRGRTDYPALNPRVSTNDAPAAHINEPAADEERRFTRGSCRDNAAPHH
jgi:hypothetical protein